MSRREERGPSDPATEDRGPRTEDRGPKTEGRRAKGAQGEGRKARSEGRMARGGGRRAKGEVRYREPMLEPIDERGQDTGRHRHLGRRGDGPGARDSRVEWAPGSVGQRSVLDGWPADCWCDCAAAWRSRAEARLALGSCDRSQPNHDNDGPVRRAVDTVAADCCSRCRVEHAVRGSGLHRSEAAGTADG
jgi:hypothetical protein